MTSKLNQDTFGPVEGTSIGQWFANRVDLARARLHRPSQKGICGTRESGAESIIISGGYADDEDHGSFIIYTGHGGLDDHTREQVRDQSIDDPGNAALITSQYERLPVRVCRAVSPRKTHPGRDGYVYGGIYFVTDHWMDDGSHGFKIVRFRLDGEISTTEPMDESAAE